MRGYIHSIASKGATIILIYTCLERLTNISNEVISFQVLNPALAKRFVLSTRMQELTHAS